MVLALQLRRLPGCWSHHSLPSGATTHCPPIHQETCISERLIRTTADAMEAEGLVAAGYDYIQIVRGPTLVTCHLF